MRSYGTPDAKNIVETKDKAEEPADENINTLVAAYSQDK